MKITIGLDLLDENHRTLTGGKAMALSLLSANNFIVPRGLCVTTHAYKKFLDSTGLGERILLELNRKNFKDMRWEEIWDASLRIRNMFMTTDIPGSLSEVLSKDITEAFKYEAVVIRSSAPGEDSSGSSFAGLHDSFVNITGSSEILEHIKKVWASLWSDKALLYRQELGLDVETSSMSVIIQALIIGTSSGVAFSISPNDKKTSVIESVYGLNQGLVDGTIEPDRWVLERESGKIVSHIPAQRDVSSTAMKSGVNIGPLDENLRSEPPLDNSKVLKVFNLAKSAEKLFGTPQDVEWTYKGEVLYTLQSRPVTAITVDEGERGWYISLSRSFDNLKSLLKRVETDLIPAMVEEADRLDKIGLEGLSDGDLALEIESRKSIYDRWVDTYWEQFIPLAHGVRLFGQFYNDNVKPSDPYEFVDLLSGTEMLSMDRNRRLEEMAEMLRKDPGLQGRVLSEGRFPPGSMEQEKMKDFIDRYGNITCGTAGCTWGEEEVIGLVLELSSQPNTDRDKKKRVMDKEGFLKYFGVDQAAFAEELLELARSSYRLRDDDNIYLAGIEAQFGSALAEGRRRMQGHESLSLRQTVERLTDEYKTGATSARSEAADEVPLRSTPRQVLGQPAGPGVATGSARVLVEKSDFNSFKSGEILICDSIDPTMTLLVPLAAGIVERRGGMLIHGAIIAREYGIPCVTGISEVTSLINTGDSVTVDGYLGIVVINSGGI